MKNPRLAAIVGVLATLLVGAMSLNFSTLPLVGSPGTTYQALFTDASGLKVGDPVEVSGIRVGAVTRLDVTPDDVVVTFKVREGAHLGGETSAAIKVGSLLGAKFLDLGPSGPGNLAATVPIPLVRTKPAYDIVEAFSDLTRTTSKIDDHQMAKALDTLATTFNNSTPDVRSVLDGVSKFSAIISTRNGEVRQLLSHAANVTGLLAQRRSDLVNIMNDSATLLHELDLRSQALHRLLVTSADMFDQLNAVVEENRAAFGPSLQHAHSLLDLLAQRQRELKSLIVNWDVFVRLFTNTLGNGPWFDSVIPNLPSHVSIGGAQ